jgi:hypothetical protein
VEHLLEQIREDVPQAIDAASVHTVSVTIALDAVCAALVECFELGRDPIFQFLEGTQRGTETMLANGDHTTKSLEARASPRIPLIALTREFVSLDGMRKPTRGLETTPSS